MIDAIRSRISPHVAADGIHQTDVVSHQYRQLQRVGLQLVERLLRRGVLIRGRLLRWWIP